MLKKIKIVIMVIVAILLISSICYEYYDLQAKNKIIYSLETKVKTREIITEKYNEKKLELEKEVDNINKVDDYLATLDTTSQENSKLLEELTIELEKIKQQNNEIETQIMGLEQQIQIKKTSSLIDKKITYNQFPKYPTGCESVALYILLKYNGIDVTVDDIINVLRKGELPHKVDDKIYGGNPELEFVGDPRNNYSYGVYNKPLMDVANIYKAGVVSKIGLEFEEMLKLVKKQRPVLVWTTINLTKPYISGSWIYEPTGQTINWISGEHVVVVIGYNANQIIVSDPYTGTIRYFDKNIFKNRYDFLGKRVLYY